MIEKHLKGAKLIPINSNWFPLISRTLYSDLVRFSLPFLFHFAHIFQDIQNDPEFITELICADKFRFFFNISLEFLEIPATLSEVLFDNLYKFKF